MSKCNFAFTWDSIHYQTVVVGFWFLYLILLSHVSRSIRLPHELVSRQIPTFNIQQEHSYFKIKKSFGKFLRSTNKEYYTPVSSCSLLCLKADCKMVKKNGKIYLIYPKRLGLNVNIICYHLLISRERGAVFRALSLTAPSCGHYLTLQSYKTSLVLNSEML